MKTNDDLIEEFQEATKTRIAGFLMLVAVNKHEEAIESFLQGNLKLIRETLTQKDAEVAEAVQKLRTEEPLYIGKTQYEFYKGDVRWVYNQALDDLITGLTPHPTDDTSDKIH